VPPQFGAVPDVAIDRRQLIRMCGKLLEAVCDSCQSANVNERPKLGGEKGRLSVWKWVRSDLGAFGQFQSVLHVNAQVAHRAVDLGMAEKDLNSAEVASRLVDDRCFRAP